MVTQQYDYWVDGHYIAATTPSEAYEWCVSRYGHHPETVRPWTSEDQDELDRDD